MSATKRVKHKAPAPDVSALPMYSFEVVVTSVNVHQAKFVIIAGSAMTACRKALNTFRLTGFTGTPRVQSLYCHGQVQS